MANLEMKTYLMENKRKELKDLQVQYEANGEITWTVFKADQQGNQKKVVLVENDDFKNGTLRIRVPCMIKLKESISFNPNRPATWLDENDDVTNVFADAVALDPDRVLDWFPKIGAPDNAQYFEPEVAFAYGLGFFAALALEAKDIIVDLNGYKLKQHEEHKLQQRFFALIELADQPFIPMQGPSNFGATLRTVKNCYIHNGILGQSSHHCIHGNSGYDIFIENINFLEFEVAAISLNGCKNVWFDHINIEKNDQTIQVLGTYSAARFIKQFVKMVQNMNLGNADLDAALIALNAEADTCFNAIIFENGVIPALFKNVCGLIDGNTYGILLNPQGVAVNSFLEDRKSLKGNQTSDVCMFNCNVDNIKGKINEIVALANPDGGIQVDTAGAAFQFFDGVANLVNDKYFYAGTTLACVQIELAAIKKDLLDNNQSAAFLGTLNIHIGIKIWKDNSDFYFKNEDGVLKLYDACDCLHLIDNEPVCYDIKCNGDSMFHVNKGVLGFKVDGVNRLFMHNCQVTNIENQGAQGSDLCGAYLASHPSQGSMVGYTGAKAFGILLTGVNDGTLINSHVSNVTSKYSSAFGFGLQNDCQNIDICNIKIDKIYSHVDHTFVPEDINLPNEVGVSRGFHVDNDCANIKAKNIDMGAVKNSEGNPFDLTFDLQSPIQIN